MREPPLISVVMTAYNHENYIADAIASVLAQDHRPFELVIVDDGSLDGTPRAIASAVAGAGIPVHRVEQKNGGQASALNAGLRVAKGCLVAFMDGDDHWNPGKLSRMVQLVEQCPDGGVYQHQVDDGAGRPFRPQLPNGDVMAEWMAAGTLNTVLNPEKLQVNVPTSGLVFRREVLDRLLPIPEALVVCPDFYLFVLGLTHGPLYSEPATLATWRTHAANATHQDRFSFKKYWLPVVFPIVNAALAERGVPVRFVFRRRELWRHPLLLARAVGRRIKRARGIRTD